MLVRLPSRAASGRQGSREVPTTIPDPRKLLKASSVPHPGGHLPLSTPSGLGLLAGASLQGSPWAGGAGFAGRLP